MHIEMVLVGMLAMAVITAVCRVLPFVLPQQSKLMQRLSGDHPAITIVGPALIVALAVATLTQPIMDAPNTRTALTYGFGALGTAGAFFALRSVGVAVVAGIVCYAGADWLLVL